jgi:hypothetical protein
MRRTQAQELIDNIRSGIDWHNNMIRLVGHMVAKGRTDAEIMGLAEHLTLAGYTVNQTAQEMHIAMLGARRKWAMAEPVDDIGTIEEQNAQQELGVVDAFDFEESAIPPRPWLVPGALLSGYTHILAAPGGSGKSLFTLQFAIVLATGQQWGKFIPRRKARSLIINVEDDFDEQRRRLAAAARVMNVDPHDLRGMIYLVDASHGVMVAGKDPHKGALVMMPVANKLRTFVQENKIDVLWADPFTETFDGDENDNSQVKWAMQIWRDEIARPTKAAVYLVHHTTKYASNGAGDVNVIRGASAIVNSARIAATLMPMTSEEAAKIGVDDDERHWFIRYDDAKANQSLKSGAAQWFKKQSITLDNGRGFDPPDEVGALVPWSPPDPFDGIMAAEINTFLQKIDDGIIDKDGVVTGVRYTSSTKGGTKETGRWAGCLAVEHFDVSEATARKLIATWLRNGSLVEKDYQCPERRRARSGLFAPLDKRVG